MTTPTRDAAAASPGWHVPSGHPNPQWWNGRQWLPSPAAAGVWTQSGRGFNRHNQLMGIAVLVLMGVPFLMPFTAAVTVPLAALLILMLLMRWRNINATAMNSDQFTDLLGEEAEERAATAVTMNATFTAAVDPRFTSASLLCSGGPLEPKPAVVNHQHGTWNSMPYSAYTLIAMRGPYNVSASESRGKHTVTVPSRWDVIEVLLDTPLAIPHVMLIPETETGRLMGRMFKYDRDYESITFNRNWTVDSLVKHHPALSNRLVHELADITASSPLPLFLIEGDRFISITPAKADMHTAIDRAIRLASLVPTTWPT